MKVALVGATGKAGSRVLNELVNRGHQVTGIVRHPENVPKLVGVTAIGTDRSREFLAGAIKGHDAVVSSVRFIELESEVIVAAVKDSGVKRYVVVGGAGSLLHADGTEEIQSFPEPFKPNLLKGTELLELLKKSGALDWTFISPSRLFRPGERTGAFRYGKDHLLIDEEGNSKISFEDFALALVDELEQPKYVRQRFTVGY
ncbi:MAG: NAD(P)-dependent oxidoreductase [Rhizobiaceae bacterium]|nr:NAD(P)-dependent oxidoreductase [Rhizobiaceae bacterium]